MKVLVVIPTYNEQQNLNAIVQGVLNFASAETDILIIDDNSLDGTGKLADELAVNYGPRVQVLHRLTKSGLGSAYLVGFHRARVQNYKVVVQMDADGSHSPADLITLITAVKNGADLAIGSRRVSGGRIEGWGLDRHLASWCVSFIVRLFLRLAVRDISSGFRCLGPKAIQILLNSPIKSTGFVFQEESLFWLKRGNCRIVELPVVFKNRVKGHSKAQFKEVLSLIRMLLRLINFH